MNAPKVDVLALLRGAIAQPNEYSTDDDGMYPASRMLLSASNQKWDEQLAKARQVDCDHTMMLAGMGYSNHDRDAQLCAIQRDQRAAGVEDVLVMRWLKGWAVRTDWADSHRVFVGYCDDPTEALMAAIKWQSRAPDRRGIRMHGSDYLDALDRLEVRHD